MKKRYKILLFLVILALLVNLVIRIDSESIKYSLQNGNIWLILVSFILTFFIYFL